MIDLVLLIARLLFVALLYLFLFAIMRTGIGMLRKIGNYVKVDNGVPSELQ